MLLGKRPKPPVMRRTTSMSGGMAVDMPDNNTLHLLQGDDGDGGDGINDPSHHHDHAAPMAQHDHGLMVMVPDQAKNSVFGSIEYHQYDEPLLGMVMSPNNSHITANVSHHTHQKYQTSNCPPHHVIHNTPHFLRTCGLCECRLAPGRDIYMYRGDTAFCSLECREKQMKQDSRKEKRKMATSNKEGPRASPPPANASTKSEATACT